MVNLLIIVGAYFGLGALSLLVFDLLTKRIRNRLYSASADTVNKLTASGSAVGRREATILVLGSAWLLWPLVLISALTGGDNGKKR